jgi:hypothetical protein
MAETDITTAWRIVLTTAITCRRAAFRMIA